MSMYLSEWEDIRERQLGVVGDEDEIPADVLEAAAEAACDEDGVVNAFDAVEYDGYWDGWHDQWE